MTVDYRGIGMTSQRARDRLVRLLREMGITSEEVLEVIRRTPRHIFVDEALASRAYENTALPIGYGQTISQPYIVARMTEAVLGSGSLARVLEIGTGCGYQTAVLAQLAGQVFSVERIQALATRARERMFALKFRNVRIRHGDGAEGWSHYAPFDAILVAAAPAGVPAALLEQLKQGGRLVIPVGEGARQELRLIQRTTDGYSETRLDSVTFVPMVNGVN